MPRYIDAEKFEKDIIGKAKVLNDEIVFESDFVYSTLYQQPTADVVEVVRCKNCAVPHNKWTGCPKLNGLIPPPDFYCGYGELKEREGK